MESRRQDTSSPFGVSTAPSLLHVIMGISSTRAFFLKSYCKLSVRKNGQWFHTDVSEEELRLLCWKPRLFDAPQDWASLAFGRREQTGLFPNEGGIVVIDEDSQWVGVGTTSMDPFFFPADQLSHKGPSMTWALLETAMGDGVTLQTSDFDPDIGDPFYLQTPIEPPTSLTQKGLHEAIGNAIDKTPQPSTEGSNPPERFVSRNEAAGWQIQRFNTELLTGWEELLEVMRDKRMMDRESLPKWHQHLMQLFGDGAVDTLIERIDREALAIQLDDHLPEGTPPKRNRPRV